nr:uridine kinase protein 1 [Hymenolepis microstoma]
MDVKIFVDTDAELRLSRRLLRDIRERGRQVNDIIRQYFTFVKPAYDSFIAPSKSRADIIVPFEEANPVAIDLLVCAIDKLLIEHIRRRCSSVQSTDMTLLEEESVLATA